MPSDWPMVAIGEVAEVFDGPHATPKTVEHGPIFLGIGALQNGRIQLGETRHVTPSDFKTWTRRVKPKGGDVVFSYETRLGEAAIIPEGFECCLGRRMALVRADPKRLEPRYFLYQFLSPYFQELIRSRTIPGATVDRIALKEFPSFLIPLPPLGEQRAIAETLGALDDRIDNLRQTNATLQSVASAFFKERFVDFGGVPPADMQDSELGSIPKGWRIGVVADVCETIFSGGTPDTRKAEYWNGELPWFSSGETRERIIIGTEKRITQAGVAGSSTRAAKPGDVLIAAAGQGHTRGQTSYCAIETYINQSVVSARADTKRCHPAWLYYNLERRYDEMRARSDSHSSRGSLTTKLLGSMPLVLPTADAIHEFGLIAEPLLNSQIKNMQQTGTLAALRDTLLPRLSSGEVRVAG